MLSKNTSIKYLPELKSPDKCSDTFSGFSKLAEQRGLIMLKIMVQHVKFVDPQTGMTHKQTKADFLQRRYPGLFWTKDLVEHFLLENKIKHRGVFRDVRGDWAFVQGAKIKRLAQVLDHKDYQRPQAKRQPYYNDQNINNFKDVHGLLYLVKLKQGAEVFVKVGITQLSLAERAPGKDSGYKIVKTLELPMKIPEAYKLEQETIKKFKEHQHWPKNKFGGYTECFSIEFGDEIYKYLVGQGKVTYDFEGLF